MVVRHVIKVFFFNLIVLLVSGSFAQKDSLSFGVIADPHYADKASTSSRCYRSSIDKVDSAVTELNKATPDFLIMLGDYVDGYTGGDGVKAIEDMQNLNQRITKFIGDLYFVMGNHDLQDLNQNEWLDNSPGKVKQGYYSFDIAPFHFVVLDGNFMSDGQHYGRDVPWVWTDTWILEDQRNWLISDLDSAGSTPTIVFTHQNLHDNSNISVENSGEVRTILENHGNVTHVLQGHEHAGQYMQINGIHYLTLMGMINCPDNSNNFALATLTKEAMSIKGYEGQPSYELVHPGLANAIWPVEGCMDSRFLEFDSTANIHVQDSCKNLVPVSLNFNFLVQAIDLWKSSIVIASAEPVSIDLVDVKGKVLFKQVFVGPQKVSIKQILGEEKGGVFYLKIKMGGDVKVHPILLAK